jgi:glycine dehydrogenase subunit 1
VALPSAPNTDFDLNIDAETSCIVVQYPGVFGGARDLTPLAELAHKNGALLIVTVTEAISFGALRSPGSMGADIVVAEGQSIGNSLNFGGPYLGLFATRQKFIRQMPGRLCGETVDQDGRRGFVLTLSTREQHIRREKATSNICTNSGLCCLAFTVHMTLLGEAGLKRLARLNHASAVALADRLAKVQGVEIVTPHFFNEFTIRTPKPGADVIDALVDEGVIGGVPASRLWPGEDALDKLILVAATEVNTAEDRDAYAAALTKVLA